MIERLLAPANDGPEGKLSDLNTLVNLGGRERSMPQFEAVLATAETGTRLAREFSAWGPVVRASGFTPEE